MLWSSLLVAVLSAAAVSAAPRDTVSRPLIVAFGDSLTSGRGIEAAEAFPAILQQRLDDAGLEYEMVNAGVSGDTTTRALRRLETALDGDVRVLIVALGANDGLRGVPVDQLKSNLGRIIEAAQARGIAVLLCGMETLPIRGWPYTVAFHNAYGELAARYKVPLVPFVMMKIIADQKMMQPDRAHPNAAGARAIAEIIWPYLNTLLDTIAVR
jgi:acyl-CoA thioesterase-1